jgi:hypothetical protein
MLDPAIWIKPGTSWYYTYCTTNSMLVHQLLYHFHTNVVFKISINNTNPVTHLLV